MISSKHITKIAAAFMALALLLCILTIAFYNESSFVFKKTVYGMEYESQLFDTNEVITIDILMDDAKWNEMLENAASETYYECDVVINGTLFEKVGLRPKGNTSLSFIANDPDNNRYSFKLEFDQFVDGQTCWGLDKLILNNNYADKTAMKEAIIYDMYQYLGADASLYNYAQISLNGEYWGVYLALEAVEESFMLRNFGTEQGNLYKPDGMNMSNKGNPNNEGGFEGKMPDMPEGGKIPPQASENEKFSDAKGFGGGMRGGFGMGSGGANLNYTDDDTQSYSTIWEGEVTDTKEADHQRVVKALKNISNGTDLETYLDVDNVLKYMAVHSFAVNEDSLSGNMAHNYYLYESGGRLNILPWDYNLAFGGMGGGSDASGVINDPIDTPFSATKFFDVLLENDEYLEKYHEYYSQLINEYVYGGIFDKAYNRINTQIDALVKSDPNSMYSYEEYISGREMLYRTVLLRAESVNGQLAGTIPSTSEGQQNDSSVLVDASTIDISVMGSIGGGGRRERNNIQQEN